MSAHHAAWLALALGLGAVSGVAAARFGASAGAAAAFVVVAAAVTVLVMRDTRVGLVLLLLVIPLDVAGRIITSPLVITAYHAVLLLSLASWAWHLVRDRGRVHLELSPVHFGAFALLAAALWSLPFSLDRQATMIATIRLGFAVALFMLFAHHLREERVAARVIAALVATSAASSVLAVVQYFFPSLSVGKTHTLGSGMDMVSRPAAFFSDPNYLAGLLSVGIVAAACRAAHARDLRAAAPWFLGAFVSSAGLMITLSRSGWVGVGIGLAVAALTSPRRRRRGFVALLLAAVALAVALSPGAAVDRLKSIGDVSADASVSTRWLMYGSTLDMFRDNWVFGTGLDAYEKAYPAYRRVGSRLDILRPHELPLSLPAQTGVVGLLAELAIVTGVGREVLRHRGREWGVWGSLSVAGLAALLAQTVFQYYLYFEYVWLFLALTVVAARMPGAAREV